MMLSSREINKLYGIHSHFYWYKKYKNRPRNAGVVIENKVEHVLWPTVYSVLSTLTT